MPTVSMKKPFKRKSKDRAPESVAETREAGLARARPSGAQLREKASFLWAGAELGPEQ